MERGERERWEGVEEREGEKGRGKGWRVKKEKEKKGEVKKEWQRVYVFLFSCFGLVRIMSKIETFC